MKIQLSLYTGDGNLQEIFSWTDTDNPLGMRFIHFEHRSGANANNVANVKLRNLRNPDQDTATCLNNVGSFNCLPLDSDR